MARTKVSLYTIAYSGIYYKGSHVPIEELIPRIKNYGYDGIEIESKRPYGFAPDWNGKKRKEIVEIANSNDIKVCAIAGYTNFQSPIVEEKENEMLRLWEEIRLARDLEAPIVRVMPAWKGVTMKDGIATYDFSRHTWKYPTTDIEMWQRCRDCLKEGAKWAEEYGVTLALQTHGPILRIPGYEDTLQMIREVGSEHLKMCLDPMGWSTTGGWVVGARDNSDYTRQAAEVCRDYIVHSHFSENFAEKPNGEVVQISQIYYSGGRGGYPVDQALINLPTWIHELKRIGYDGYMSYEICSPVVSSPEGLQSDRTVKGIEEVDRRAKLAVKYMKGLIAKAQS